MSEHSEVSPRTPETRITSTTCARVGLAITGVSVATTEQLRFQLDHALARDAVHAQLNTPHLLESLRALGLDAMALRSAIPTAAHERKTYLLRPDLGRRLDSESAQALRHVAAAQSGPPDVIFSIADGLSAVAVERHALRVMEAILQGPEIRPWSIGPVCLVSQGRVAVGDHIGQLLHASLLVMLIGERPGLSASDSLGAYLTWHPRLGRTDAERVCISNIHDAGLHPAQAASRILEQIDAARRLGATGVALKPLALNP